jgi:phytoene desaturase
MKKTLVIGSGFASLSTACYLAKAGFEVQVFEKNSSIGGRARLLEIEGFRFDMGPSWYWMPDVFNRFFADFGKRTSDYYDLVRLGPAYRVFFNRQNHIDIPGNITDTFTLFEQIEKGSALKLKRFLKEAEYNYKVGVENLVYRPGVSPTELVTPQTISKFTRFFTNIRRDIRKHFKNEQLISILEFPVLFLGAKPQNTPSFYSFMNYADLVLGTWYPKGGMHQIVLAMEKLAKSLGVTFHTNSAVDELVVENNKISGMKIGGEFISGDIVVSGADYQHTETLLPETFRNYNKQYWNKKTFAPSALVYFLGIDKKLSHLQHHNLFFDADFDQHAQAIYDRPSWPETPLFYASFPSITDPTVAPEGKETGFLLLPLAPDLNDEETVRERYFQEMVQRIEQHTKQAISSHIRFKQSYCVSDFKNDYNAYKGNAYGMANTLTQTSFLRPKINSKKLRNLYYTGQLTVPGPGVPPALISGKIAAEQVTEQHTNIRSHETVI